MLSNHQIRHLRRLAHSLKPVVMTGANGITDAVLNEIDLALTAHELIKVKVRAEDREERSAMIKKILNKTGAEQIQVIGHTLTTYRISKEKKIALPQ